MLTELGGVVSLGNSVVGLESSEVVNIELDALASSSLATGLTGLETFQTSLLEALLVDFQAALLSHDLGQIDWETVGVVKSPDILA